MVIRKWQLLIISDNNWEKCNSVYLHNLCTSRGVYFDVYIKIIKRLEKSELDKFFLSLID